jgi:hypothetical protein
MRSDWRTGRSLTAGRVVEDMADLKKKGRTSFSEEKEAKRLSFVQRTSLRREPRQPDESFLVLFSKKNFLLHAKPR